MQSAGTSHPMYSASVVPDFLFTNTTGSNLVFYNLALVTGSFAFNFNAVTTAEFPVLSAITGSLVVSHNYLLVSFRMTALNRIGGTISFQLNSDDIVASLSFMPLFQVYCTGGFETANVTDLQNCAHIRENRRLTKSLSTKLSSSLLTYINGYLDINSNTRLATVLLPSLAVVGDDFTFLYNPALTLAQFPSLTFIGNRILFCSNNAAFRIPSGPPNAPTGGLVVTGAAKGRLSCFLQQGSGECGQPVICP
jgi:hypothetical protein